MNLPNSSQKDFPISTYISASQQKYEYLTTKRKGITQYIPPTYI